MIIVLNSNSISNIILLKKEYKTRFWYVQASVKYKMFQKGTYVF